MVKCKNNKKGRKKNFKGAEDEKQKSKWVSFDVRFGKGSENLN
jgi:hypothetical protein